jgi:hypothetical protein
MTILQQLQSLLARLYAVPMDFAVEDFLIADKAQANPAAPASDEHVLVSQDNDSLHVGVYIDAEVLDRLNADSPMNSIGDSNLADYCTALEGVSHFHYLTWRAAHADPVSLIELELQAEVDKYAMAVWLFAAQLGRVPATLHERLFHCVRFREGLDSESIERYQAANRGAARFCRELEQRYLRGRRVRASAWLQEMRNFYRLTHAPKLRRVTAN